VAKVQKRVAVIPVINKNKICLVTGRGTGNWMLPTGKHEKRRTNRQVAILEAFEEAGLVGKIDKKFSKSVILQSPSGKKKRKTTLFLIRVDKQLKQWPEKEQRRRATVKLCDLEHYITDKKLQKLLKQELNS